MYVWVNRMICFGKLHFRHIAKHKDKLFILFFQVEIIFSKNWLLLNLTVLWIFCLYHMFLIQIEKQTRLKRNIRYFFITVVLVLTVKLDILLEEAEKKHFGSFCICWILNKLMSWWWVDPLQLFLLDMVHPPPPCCRWEGRWAWPGRGRRDLEIWCRSFISQRQRFSFYHPPHNVRAAVQRVTAAEKTHTHTHTPTRLF